MRVEERTTFGKPCLVLIMESQEDSRMIDRVLGDCGKDPCIKLGGTVSLDDADEPGPQFLTHYVIIWNPNNVEEAPVPAVVGPDPLAGSACAVNPAGDAAESAAVVLSGS